MSKIIKVGSGEYWNVFLEDTGLVYGYIWNGKTWPYTQYQGVKDIIDVQGGQYSCIALDKNGASWELFQNGANKKIELQGELISSVQMLNQAKLLISDRGNVYYLAEDATKDKDALNLGKSWISITPKMLLGGYSIKKIAVAENLYGVLLLSNAGSVYTLAPVTASISQIVADATDIAMIRGAYIIVEKDDILAGGRTNMNYITAPDKSSVQANRVSIKKYWPDVKFPIKQIAGSWNTLHIIDANDDMYGAGENIQGEVGIGKGCPDWKNYKGADGKTLQPFQWNWSPGQMIQSPVKLDGKWKQICKSGSMAFQNYAQDINGQWYSWGRDKGRSLANGVCFPDNDLAAKYPNHSDLWYPMPVNPEKISDWKLITSFNPQTEPNNASWTPIPPPPPPPVPDKKLLGTVGIGEWNWKLYNDGSAESHK